jgi:hypothetical protein
VPACGRGFGHAASGALQAHCGGSMVWQMGYSKPPLQALQLQMVPSSYQHASVGSEHCVAAAGGVLGHAAGSGGTAAQSAGGCLTDQAPLAQRPVVRHRGRRSSPQLQSAAPKPAPEAGKVHGLPALGGSFGQDELDEPPAADPAEVEPPAAEPPTLDPAFPVEPPGDAPAPPSLVFPPEPAADAPPPAWSPLKVPPPQPNNSARGRQRLSSTRMVERFCATSIPLAIPSPLAWCARRRVAHCRWYRARRRPVTARRRTR